MDAPENIEAIKYKNLLAVVVAESAISYFQLLDNKAVAFFKFLDSLIILFGRDHSLVLSEPMSAPSVQFGNAFSLLLKSRDKSIPEPAISANDFLKTVAKLINSQISHKTLKEAYEEAAPRFTALFDADSLPSSKAYWGAITERISDQLRSFRIDLNMRSNTSGLCKDEKNILGVKVVKFGTHLSKYDLTEHRIDNCRWILTPQEYTDEFRRKSCVLAERALVVPTHIHGTPYYEVVFLFQKSFSKTEEWMFRFYRDALSILNTDLRQITENSYLRLIKDTVNSLQETGTLNDLIKALENLSKRSPYPDFEFNTDVATDKEIPELSTDQINKIEVKFKNESTSSIDGVEQISPNNISSTIRSAIFENRRNRASVLYKEQEVFNNIGHILKDMVKITGWQSANSKVTLIKRDFDYFLKHKPEEINIAINRSARALKTFSLIQGLGQFITYLKYQVKTDNWRKLASEVDTKQLHNFSSTDSLELFANSVHNIASIICQALDWPHLITRFNGKILLFQDIDHYFDPSQYHFPPFKPGSDVSFLFYFYLSEPIVNAITAHSIAAKGTDHPLEIEISIPDQSNETLLYTVINLCVDSKPERIPGYKNTLELLHKFGLTSTEPKVADEWIAEANAFKIYVTTTLEPATMARSFIKGGEVR